MISVIQIKCSSQQFRFLIVLWKHFKVSKEILITVLLSLIKNTPGFSFVPYEKSLKFSFICLGKGSSVIRQNSKSQRGCFKKTKYAKFSEKRTFLTPWYAHVRLLKVDKPYLKLSKHYNLKLLSIIWENFQEHWWSLEVNLLQKIFVLKHE